MTGLTKEAAPAASAAAAAPSLTQSSDVNKDEMTFGEAFATARAEGAKDFLWNGLSYSTAAAPGAKASRPRTAAVQPEAKPTVGPYELAERIAERNANSPRLTTQAARYAAMERGAPAYGLDRPQERRWGEPWENSPRSR